MNLRPLAALVSISFLAASCGVKDKKAASPPALPVTAGVVEKKDVPLEAVAVGHVDAFSTVAVRTRVGGEVTKVGFREGQDVKQGDLLFEIDRRPYQAALAESEANLERDRARAREADENLKRYAELVKKDYVTQEQFSQATANADALKATVKADDAAVETARLNVSYCQIAAPIPGRTGGLLVHSGNMIKANDDRALVVINQVEPIYVTFSLPEAVLADVKKRAAAGTLKVSALPNGPGLNPSEGTLTFIDNTVDTTTGTINLKATFPNRDRALWPGQFTNVSLTLATEANSVVAPTPAVQAGQQGSYVYVIKPDDTVEARTVVVRRTWQQWTVIDKGLSPGERVVTDGQLRLAPGAKVAIKVDAVPAPAAPAPAEKKS
ncbi:MAG TPA: efflux RND transporter periplasmic adaptor subunit [Thermoanaerobaculia bacterium]|nr:efflux RND transporter periplasmic adaptor subunit [Thermoanaerobaculia bacterium]